MKGSSGVKSFATIKYCSYGYHLCTGLLIFLAILSIIYYKRKLRLEEAYKEKIQYDFDRDGKIDHIINTTVWVSFFVGLLGGLVGLGGGSILTPLWLKLGLQPKRAAATANNCVLFSSFISLILIAISGGYDIPVFFALLVFIQLKLLGCCFIW